MEDTELRSRICELTETLSAVPKTADVGSGEGSYISQHSTGKKTVDELLDHLRLQVKYLMFDLEATRRENRYLRQMLERRPNLGDNPENP